MSAIIIPLVLFVTSLHAQSITGKWRTVDDETGEERSIVEIFEKGGKIHGKVIRIFPKPGDDPDPVCDECDENDPRYKKKIIGMEIIKDMKANGSQFDNGEILDPANGRVYRCKLWMENGDLKVRGYWGPFYRTQTWKRAE